MATVKYNLGTVGGIAVTELWSGIAGNIKGSGNGTITLSDDLSNYKFLILDFCCSCNDTEIWYYSRTISVKQVINYFNNTNTGIYIAFACGYRSSSDYFTIYKNSTTKALNISCYCTQCLRIVGIN